SQPITVETPEIDTLFEVHLSRSRSLKRPVPAVRRLEIVFVDGQEFGPVEFFRHESSLFKSRYFKSRYGQRRLHGAVPAQRKRDSAQPQKKLSHHDPERGLMNPLSGRAKRVGQ